jgi:DNA-directed RNA polymerase subunit A"
MRGDVDKLEGVTENIIVGQPIRMGTGDVHLISRRKEEIDAAKE